MTRSSREDIDLAHGLSRQAYFQTEKDRITDRIYLAITQSQYYFKIKDALFLLSGEDHIEDNHFLTLILADKICRLKTNESLKQICERVKARSFKEAA